MDLFKRLSLKASYAGRNVAGGLIVLSAMAMAASAAPPLPTIAPEIDPGSLYSAFTVLTGSVLLLVGRRFK